MTRQEELVRASRKEYPEWEEAQCHFIDGAHYADSYPHWISVEDELPPKKSEYEDLSNDVLATDGKKIYKSFYNYGFEEWFTREIWRIDNITHWMPLPSIEHLKD